MSFWLLRDTCWWTLERQLIDLGATVPSEGEPFPDTLPFLKERSKLLVLIAPVFILRRSIVNCLLFFSLRMNRSPCIECLLLIHLQRKNWGSLSKKIIKIKGLFTHILKSLFRSFFREQLIGGKEALNCRLTTCFNPSTSHMHTATACITLSYRLLAGQHHSLECSVFHRGLIPAVAAACKNTAPWYFNLPLTLHMNKL